MIHLDLMQGLIIQLCNAIYGNVEFVRCLECLKWMKNSSKGGSGGGTSGKNYCDSTCRNRAFRRRRDLKLMSEFKKNFSLKYYTKPLIKFFEYHKSPKSDLQEKPLSYFIGKYSDTPGEETIKIVNETLASFQLNYSANTSIESLSAHLAQDEESLKFVWKILFEKFGPPLFKSVFFDWDKNHK